MCGIFGGINLFSSAGSVGNTVMRRRGPDDFGAWEDKHNGVLLCHVRLSIIDTSEAGHQPMVSADGRVVMIYNGELYNYRELRDELKGAGAVFKGHSDSEVLLELFRRYGDACLRRLNGIFAVAFWERDTEVLTLARDPLGVKPLYVTEFGRGFAFSSELKALLRSGIVKPELDPCAVLAHLGYLWSPGQRTIVHGVQKVLPGHVMRVKKGAVISDGCYRDIHFEAAESARDVGSLCTSVAEQVRAAVERQMIADVPVGAFLSGGLDSSAVVAFAQRHLNAAGSGQRLQCFTISTQSRSTIKEGFAEDLPYARKVAAHLGTDLSVVTVDSQTMADRLGEMVYFLDEPNADPAALNTLFIAELARSQGIKVLLSGTGGDDVFTGYRRHFALAQERWWAAWPQPVRQSLSWLTSRVGTKLPQTRRLSKAFQYAGESEDRRLASYFLWLSPLHALRLLAPNFRGSLSADDLYQPLLATLANVPKDTPSINRMLYLECKHFLADHNLNYTDKMGMAASVEVRVPLLDPDLVDFAATLPVKLKQRGTVGKWIFRKAMEPYLPRDVIYRSKTGFGVPLRDWLRGSLRDRVHDVLSPTALGKRGIFESRAVEALLEADRKGQIDASYTIFSLVCLELWCQQYLDGDYAVDGYVQTQGWSGA